MNGGVNFLKVLAKSAIKEIYFRLDLYEFVLV